MTNFERLEKTIIDWKAFLAIAEVNGDSPMIRHYSSGLGALESALNSFKRPSNTQMQTEACKRNPKECDFYDGIGCAGVPTLCTGRPR